MGTVLTVMNMKGGVGKTTVATHIAGIAPRLKLDGKEYKKVLAIDYDPQFNMSQALLPAKTYFQLEQERSTTLSILVDSNTDLNPYELQVAGNYNPPPVAKLATNIYSPRAHGGKLDIIPSTLDLMYVALGQSENQTKPMEERFEKFLADCRDNYDLTIIDCHPAGSLFTKTSLKNSDHVLIPVMPQRYAVRGIGLMMKFISAKKASEKSPKPHILFNNVSRTKLSDQEIQIRNNPDYRDHCLTHTLKKYTAFSEPEEGRGFVWASRKPYSTEAFANLISVTRELFQRMGLR
ncbi:MAG: ParA family protein [Xanthobacteraceae bacterium]|nr:ParA family protein [Xanthobacteraceae bacterium]